MVEEQTVFGSAIDFIAKLGFYDVVLPFLLTFTLVYAILDKTRVLGVEKVDDVEVGKKNLNAVVAFVMGLLVVFIKPLVMAINEALANIVVLMIIGVFFMALIAIFLTQGQQTLETIAGGKWKTFFIFFMFFGIVLIFLNAFRTADGRTWLTVIWDFVKSSWTSSAVASLLFVAGLVFFIYFVTKSQGPSREKKQGQDLSG